MKNQFIDNILEYSNGEKEYTEIESTNQLTDEELDVKNIYLYGSYVKGTHTSDSDIDIAVVGDDFTGDPIEDTLILMRIRRKVDTRIEPRLFKTCDFNSSNPFAKEIIETGIMVI